MDGKLQSNLLKLCPNQQKREKLLETVEIIINYSPLIKDEFDKTNQKIIFNIPNIGYFGELRLFEKEDDPRLYLKLPRIISIVSRIKSSSAKNEQMIKIMVGSKDDRSNPWIHHWGNNWEENLIFRHIPEGRARVSTKKSSNPAYPRQYIQYIEKNMPALQGTYKNNLEMVINIALEKIITKVSRTQK